ncbi:MAG: ATP-binding protein, partial [candidate division WOR-3 bacterium]|nr:ATP-binding protein [candidate division WOR-3 bacterium]
NPAACRITGYSEAELLDMNIEDVVHPDYKELIKKRAAARLRGEDPLKHYQLRITAKSGKVKWIDFRADRITYNGKNAVLTSVIDITDKKNLEKQLLQSQKMESIGHLVGGIAHDFNNLLTPITMNAEFIEYNSEKNSVIHRQAKSIVQSSKRAKSIVKKLLAFGKKQVMEMKSIDLNSIIEDLMKLLESTVSSNIEVVLHLSDDIKRIEADPIQIEQILMNLAINAQDAVEGNGKIAIETSMVDLDMEYASIYTDLKQGEYVLLTVSDNGRGMTKEVQPHIFEPFFTTKEQGKGTGLGLSTVYGIVKQHNASINVYSEPEEGSVFKIYFPVKDKDTVKIKEETADPVREKTILIVEDNEQILAIAEKMLKKKGYTVYSSSNPVHGIKIAHKYKDEIDLILSDIIMPGMHGREMCEEIKSIIPDVKILYMSGYSKEVLSEENIDGKRVKFIPKPFSGRKLLKYIEDILQID